MNGLPNPVGKAHINYDSRIPTYGIDGHEVWGAGASVWEGDLRS